MSNVRSGRGFEYGLATELAAMIEASLIDDQAMRVARDYFEQCALSERRKIRAAAKDVALFLTEHETRLVRHECTIRIQSDMRGTEGDVRDIVIHTPRGEVGISAKNRHHAVKHSRLSAKIDFGQAWTGNKSSQDYYDQIAPVFEELRNRKRDGQLWRNLSDKQERIYLPILHAFNAELQRIYDADRNNMSKKLMTYLLGTHDYYKVAKINGRVSIQSFNMHGTLEWGSRLPLPGALTHTDLKRKTTLLVTFDKGWQLSFRIHSASSKIEPSLKFDIQIEGLPPRLARQEMRYE